MSWCALPEIRVMACSSLDPITQATALHGNDLSTFPDFPAEIRAPVGAPSGFPPSRFTSVLKTLLRPEMNSTCWWL